MYEEIIQQIQDLNQKLVEQDIFAAGRGFYKILEKKPFPDRKDAYLALSLENKKEYLLEFAPNDMTPVDMQKYLRRALFLMVLDHQKCVIGARDFSMDPARCFIIMDWVEGKNLQSIMKRYKLNLREALWIMVDLTHALEHLAEFGFVHRNLSPQHIILQNKTGRAYLSGVQYIALSDFVQTRLEVNDHYSSPELTRSLLVVDSNEPITPWSDIYSLGAIFYHLLLGDPPFPSNRNIEKWARRPSVPSVKSDVLSRRERKYCQELIDNVMHPNFLKRWSPTRIRRYIMAFLGDSPRQQDMQRFL